MKKLCLPLLLALFFLFPASASAAWILDLDPPTCNGITVSPSGSQRPGTLIDVSVTAQDVMSNISAINLYRKAPGESTFTGISSSSSSPLTYNDWNTTGATLGQYIFRATATDGAGNTGSCVDNSLLTLASLLEVSCTVNGSFAPITVAPGATVIWAAGASGGMTPYTYSWSGDAGGTTASITTSYSTIGTKSSSATVNSDDGQTVLVGCPDLTVRPAAWLKVSGDVHSNQ